MQLQLLTFSNLVSAAAAAVQGTARQLVDLTVGSTLRAVLEANASIALWMQWLTLQVLRTTRAATSEGVDLDTWVADFDLSRLPPVAAVGTVSFARFVPAVSSIIPVGTAVRTADGSQTFLVVRDAAAETWDEAQDGYVLPAGMSSAAVPVVASVPGSGGNVQAGTVSLILAALPGIDTVTNTVPMMGGVDAESDAALRFRFRNFVNTRTRATLAAVAYAVESVQQGLSYSIQENVAPDGSSRVGTFIVTVDDGSGAPSAELQQTIAEAIEAVRPVGSNFMVRPPLVSSVEISLVVLVSPGVVRSMAWDAVEQAIAGYIKGLGIGEALPWSRLVQVTYAAYPGIANVTNLVINGDVVDIIPSAGSVVRLTSVTVN